MYNKFKKSTLIISICICFVIVTGFSIGYIYTTSKAIDNNDKLTDHLIKSNNLVTSYDDLEIKDNDTNAVLISKKIYSICGHEETESFEISKEISGMSEFEFKQLYNGWNIEQFDDKKIIISMIINEKCSNHYVIRELDEKVAVYYQDSVNNGKLKQLLNISINTLSIDDQSKVKKGIIIDSNEKLAEFLEDFES